MNFRSYELSLLWTNLKKYLILAPMIFRSYEQITKNTVFSLLCTYAYMNFRSYALSRVWNFAPMNISTEIFRSYEHSHVWISLIWYDPIFEEETMDYADCKNSFIYK